jgi:TolB-like protein
VGSVSEHDDQNEGVDAAEARPGIAVLPFGIVSDEPGKDYLADGVTDDIITALARYRWFRVVVRGSVFALRDTTIDAGKTAHLLGARYALHGSVRHSAQRLRIS